MGGLPILAYLMCWPEFEHIEISQGYSGGPQQEAHWPSPPEHDGDGCTAPCLAADQWGPESGGHRAHQRGSMGNKRPQGISARTVRRLSGRFCADPAAQSCGRVQDGWWGISAAGSYHDCSWVRTMCRSRLCSVVVIFIFAIFTADRIHAWPQFTLHCAMWKKIYMGEPT